MILEGPKVILYMEPKQQVSEAIYDSLTIKMFNAFKNSVGKGMLLYDSTFTPNKAWESSHKCSCGRKSSLTDYFLENGQITNSLCVHYLAVHRKEVPEFELEKVRALKSSDFIKMSEISIMKSFT